MGRGGRSVVLRLALMKGRARGPVRDGRLGRGDRLGGEAGRVTDRNDYAARSIGS